MTPTPFQTRRLYREGRLGLNPAASLSAPPELGKRRRDAWIRTVRRALHYLKNKTNSEKMAGETYGIRQTLVSPQSIRQDLTRGFHILWMRGYFQERDGVLPASGKPADQWPDHSSGPRF